MHEGNRAEGSALNQNRFLVQDLAWLHDVTVSIEHDCTRQLFLDQLQIHQSVVDARKPRSREFDQV